MKLARLLLILFLPIVGWCQANTCDPLHNTQNRYCNDSQTISTSGGTIKVFSNGGLVTTFEELVTGAPSTVSIVVQGCAVGNTCDTLDTNTTVGNSLRSPTIGKTYYWYVITATWTGGTSPTVVINTQQTVSRLGNGSVGTSLPSGPSGFLGDGSEGPFNCTGDCPLAGEHWYSSLNITAVGKIRDLATSFVGPLIIRVTGACTVAGTISVSNITDANWLGSNSYPWGGAPGGGGGGGTAAGTAGQGVQQLGGLAGGGAAGAASGGIGGAATALLTSFIHYFANIPWSPNPNAQNNWSGGNGGSGGSGGPVGGYAGGSITLICGSLNFTGTIDVRGAPGANSTANNMGASGGGGGGFVIIRSPNIIANTGTIQLNGGAGGTCASFTGCGVGGVGANGWSLVLSQ